MRKQYIFLALIIIILYISYLIINFKYKEYKINSSIEYIINLNKDIENKIVDANFLIKYKTSGAYKNRILKEQQWYRNRWERVVYLMTEEKYNTYTQNESIIKESIDIAIENEWNSIIKDMSVFERRIYFLFDKEKVL